MNEDIQPKTVDKGWASMKALLDQEMPGDEKRRRIIWWWFALLLLPLTAVGGWYWGVGASSDKVPVEQPKVSPSMPFAAEQPNSAASDSEIKRSIIVPETEETEIRNTEAKATKKVFVQKQTLPNTSSKLVEEARGNESPRVLNAESQNSTIAQPELNSQELDGASKSPETSVAVVVPATNTVVNMLPISAPFVRSQRGPIYPTPAMVEIVPVKNTIIPTKKSPTWALGVGTTLGTERFTAFNSFGAGLVIHWQPMRRWGLRSGLNYVQYFPSEKSQPTASVNYEQYSEALNSEYVITDLGGNTLPSSSNYLGQVDAIIIPVARLSMVELPLLISCNLPHRIKVFSGITSTYVLDSKARKESYSTNYKFNTSADPNNQSLNDLATSSLDRWRFDFQAGFGLGLGRQWELGFFAKLPLQRLNPASTINTSNGGNIAYLDSFNASINVENRLPMIFALQANYYLNRQ